MMRKLFIAGLFVLILALPVPGASAQGDGAIGVIEAQVLNGTEDGTPVDGLTVSLRTFQDKTSELELQTAITDAEGRVRFEGVDSSPDITYILLATYADIEYGKLSLNFQEGETTISTSFNVYETTDDPDSVDIQVERMHVFLEFEGGAISVGELLIFTNTGNKTFIGTRDSELDRHVTLRFILPQGATDLQFQMGGGGERYLITKDGFVDTEPIRPDGGQQVLYGYTMNYGHADTFDLVRPLLYPTANLNVLLPRVGVDISSDQVKLSEIRTVGGQTYLNLNGQGFDTGEELTLHLAGLQDISDQSASSSVMGMGSEPSALDPKWIALGLAALALAAGVIYPALRKSATGAPDIMPVESSTARLDRLLQSIANLDDLFEAGRLDEASYRSQRQSLKSEALALMQES